jgi:hypothetical protein
LSKQANTEAVMGERAEGTLFRPEFNRAVRVEAARSAVTDDAGALLLREVAEQLGYDELAASLLDHRAQHLVTHPLTELVLTRVLLLAQGWRDQVDADALRDDAALRLAVSTRRGAAPLEAAATALTPEGLASQPTLSRMQGMLASKLNRRRLAVGVLDRACARMRRAHGRRDEMTFDVDSFAYDAHGKQEGVAYNGHYRTECFHPLVAYSDTGDLLAIRLRPGNVHTADDVRSFLEPMLPQLRTVAKKVWLRIDSGYANGQLLAWLQHRGLKFITRLRNNPALSKEAKTWRERTLAEWKKGPADDGRPRQATFEYWYRSKRWTRVVRVVAVLVERDYAHGEMLHHEFFLATNAARREGTSDDILARYRHRGEGEQRIGEFVNDLAPTLSSVPRSREGSVAHKRPVGAGENEVSLLLAALAYNLLQALRCLVEGELGIGISIRRLRERLLKAGALVVRHARQVTVRIGAARAELWALVGRLLRTAAVANTEVNA